MSSSMVTESRETVTAAARRVSKASVWSRGRRTRELKTAVADLDNAEMVDTVVQVATIAAGAIFVLGGSAYKFGQKTYANARERWMRRGTQTTA